VFFPAEGYKWNDLKRYNAQLRVDQAHLSWADARPLLANATENLMAFLYSQPNDVLYGGPMQGANNAWTVGRWAEASGPGHFRSARKYTRQRLTSPT
jgi:hypothetical protein